MYQDYDYYDMAKEVRENLARIYAESFQEQEYVDSDAADETYRKIQVILNCPEMEKCHPFLYTLDMENVNESDTEKVNRIYDLGVERGIIREENAEGDGIAQDGLLQKECDGDCDDDELCGGPSDSLTDQEMKTNPAPVIPMDNLDMKRPIYTVLYSGMKEGDLKMGEFYSMAGSTEGAKEECMSQLTSQGYSAINVMAVEQTSPSYGSVPTEDIVDDDGTGDIGVGDVYNEDDSEEYLKQETGDTDSDTDGKSEGETEQEGSSSEEGNGETENTEDDSDTEAEDVDSKGSGETSDGGTEENASDGSEGDSTGNDADGSEKDEKDGSKEDETDTEDDGTDKEDGSEEKEDKDEEPKKLTADEKNALKEEYTKIFKDVLKKTELEKSVTDMTLQERTDFYQKLAEKWTKNDPSDFMDDKDQEKLNNTVVKVD